MCNPKAGKHLKYKPLYRDKETISEPIFTEAPRLQGGPDCPARFAEASRQGIKKNNFINDNAVCIPLQRRVYPLWQIGRLEGNYQVKKGGSNMKKTVFISGILLLMLIFSQSLCAGNSKEKSAVASSDSWLSLVDSWNYSGSWKHAAEYFRNAVTEEQWINSMKSFRKPLGRALTREIISKQYMTSLPGAPDGEYVIIQYSTSFENKKSAVETVTPMLDKDNIWRVSGYFIK